MPTRADPVLVKALARAFRYQRLLDEERYASISEMAAAEKIDRGYLGRVLQLTLLAPASSKRPWMGRSRRTRLFLPCCSRSRPIGGGNKRRRSLADRAARSSLSRQEGAAVHVNRPGGNAAAFRAD